MTEGQIWFLAGAVAIVLYLVIKEIMGKGGDQ